MEEAIVPLETFAHPGSLPMREHNIPTQRVSLEEEVSSGCEAAVWAPV